MTKTTPLIWAATTTAILALTACSSDTSAEDAAPSTQSSPSTNATLTKSPTPAQETAPVSDIEAAKNKMIQALTDLGIEHTEPARAEAAPGAKATFNLTINGHESGLHVFPSEETRDAWSEVSNNFGGIHVAYDTSALSLNSRDGITNSAEIAPQLAQALNGTAHGV